MYTFVLLAVAVFGGAVAQQYRDPKTAAILTDARYLSGDGTFGAAYTQEDGVQFKEETDADGNRRGAYSYVDPSGVRRTVSYTAGKNGFQASGDHLPQAPPAPPQPAPQSGYAPQPQYNPPAPSHSNYNGPEDDGSYSPEKYENQYNGPSQSQPQYAPQPQPQRPQYAPQYNPPQPQYNQYQPPVNAIPQYQPTTPPSHRFYPPGKLDLNRTPDGFSYSFSKA